MSLSLIERFKLIRNLVDSKITFLKKWVDFISWFRNLCDRLDQISQVLSSQSLTDGKLSDVNANILSMQREIDVWKTKIIELAILQKQAKMSIIDQNTLRPYNLEGQIVNFKDKINSLLKNAKEEANERMNLMKDFERFQSLCSELINDLDLDEVELQKLNLKNLSPEALHAYEEKLKVSYSRFKLDDDDDDDGWQVFY